MYRKILFILTLMLFALVARAESVNITNAELSRLLARGVPVIDIRTAGEWKSTGVIAGSKLITFFDEKGRVDTAQWLSKAQTVAGPEQPVILICRSGKRSTAATQFLIGQAGYKTLYNVSKGLNGWVDEGRPTVPPVTSMAVCAPGAIC